MKRRGHSPEELRELGHPWPDDPLVVSATVSDAEGRVDVLTTLAKLRRSLAFYQGQVREAQAFKAATGADYADFTDRFDEHVKQRDAFRRAVEQVEAIQAALPREAAEPLPESGHEPSAAPPAPTQTRPRSPAMGCLGGLFLLASAVPCLWSTPPTAHVAPGTVPSTEASQQLLLTAFVMAGAGLTLLAVGLAKVTRPPTAAEGWGTWRRLATGAALVACLLEAALLGVSRGRFPTPPQGPLDLTPANAAAELDRVEREYLDRLPPFADNLCGDARLSWQRAALCDPDDFRRSEPWAERVEEYDEALQRLRPRYQSAAALMIGVLLLGAAALGWSLWRDSLRAVVGAGVLAGLMISSIGTELFLGRDMAFQLVQPALPMFLGIAAVVLLRLRERLARPGPAGHNPSHGRH
jgi:hypothetical protein